MTVSSEITKVSYLGDGIIKIFPITFGFHDDLHIKAILRDSLGVETPLLILADYILSGASETSISGTLTTLVAPVAGETLIIKRNVTKTQEIDYVANDKFPENSHEAALDKLTQIVQQLGEEQGRNITLQETSSKSNITIPDPKALEIIRWNTSADSFENVNISSLPSTIVLPSLSVNNNAVSFDGTTGKQLKDSGIDSTKIITENNTKTLANKTLVTPVIDSHIKAKHNHSDDQNAGKIIASNSEGLTDLLHPSDQGWADIYKSGYKPSFFNQQWGGAQWGQLPDGSFGEIATGYIEANTVIEFGNTNVNHDVAQSFKVSETGTFNEVWLKLYKNGNPSDHVSVDIYSDSGNSPSAIITNGSLNVKQGQEITSNTDGEWYKFTFANNPTLTANTRYWTVISRGGVGHASIHYILLQNNNAKYPHGELIHRSDGGGWLTDTSAGTINFLIVLESSTQFLQKNGLFDGKLAFNEGLPLNQSKGLTKPLKHFFNDSEFSYRGVWENLTKDKTFADFSYGVDHDRIVLRCNVITGFVQVDLYEQDGTKHTVTGTIDVSTGTHDIWLSVRSKGDGSDYLRIYVDGVSQGVSLNNQTFVFDHNFKNLGHYTLGGGFGLAPTWTQDLDMSVLPSAAGWTYVGTNETTLMSVQSGLLYQEGQAGVSYYNNNESLSNSNGWTAVFKVKNTFSASNFTNIQLSIFDGVKVVEFNLFDYFSSSMGKNNQMDMRQDNVVHITGRGSDVYIYINGKLIIDGAELFITTTAVNKLSFGDRSGSIQGSSIWGYVKHLSNGFMPHEFTSGICHEASFFQGDKSAFISSMYNSGNLISTKEYCGIEKNYIEAIEETNTVKGIVSTPSTTATTHVPVDDLDMFILAPSEYSVKANISARNNTGGSQVNSAIYIDGKTEGDDLVVGHSSATQDPFALPMIKSGKIITGLHKVEIKYAASGTIASLPFVRRQLIVKTK